MEAIIAIGGSILTLVATFKLPGDEFREEPAKILVAQSAMFGDAAVSAVHTGLGRALRRLPCPIERAAWPSHTRTHNVRRDAPAFILFKSI
jgi:hypothetical protein